MSDAFSKHNSFWLETQYGKELFEYEQNLIKKVLSKIFGLHILQIGLPAINYFTDGCRVNHKMVVSNKTNFKSTDERSTLYCKDSLIPLETNSIDAVLIAHELEFSQDPHAVIREIDRILLPEGHLIILAFNPWSLWGLRSRLTQKYPEVMTIEDSRLDKYPWDGKWLTSHRIIDWLSLLNYEIEQKHYYYFKPCINSQKILNSMRFCEQIGKIIPLGAAAYCIMAKKKREAMLTLTTDWQKEINFVTNGNVVEPTMRVNSRE